LRVIRRGRVTANAMTSAMSSAVMASCHGPVRGHFARLWERYDVTRRTAASTKTFHHPQVGTITLGFQGMQLEGPPGQRLGIYLAEPGTPDYDAMILLDMTAPRHIEQTAARQQH